MSSKKVAINTIGCKLNSAESSAILKEFREKGYESTDFNSKADVYIINTCTVTENAEKECRQIVRRALRNNPEGYIIVVGCYSQIRPEEISQIKGVDLILGTNEKFHIFDFSNNFQKKERSAIYVDEINDIHNISGAFPDLNSDRTRAFLKIQDGCDYKCTYCTIPAARGKSRSLSLDSVVKNFKFLVDIGYKEIVLTGVNVGDYGRKNGNTLITLLRSLITIDGDYRIRISSIEPNLISDEMIDLIKNSDKLCKHFHIPLQGGSDNLLKSMNRCYSVEFYEKQLNKIIENIPNCGIGVDVITGFPGETDKDFLDTYTFLEKLPISYIHSFSFSPRPGTKAYSMSNNVSKKIAKERTIRLRNLSKNKRLEFHKSNLENVSKVLFETIDKATGTIKGYTSNYIRINHIADEVKENTFYNIKIINANADFCFGEIIY